MTGDDPAAQAPEWSDVTSAGDGRRLLSYREANASPCLSCISSPCCTHLMLLKFQLEDLGDVDYLVYLSGFEGILLGVDPGGMARVYLSQPCSHLDVPTGLCDVHGTPAQPNICVSYNAHSCQYRLGMTVDLNPRQPLMDQRRVRWYAQHVAFDEERKVAALPPWDEVLAAFSEMTLMRWEAPVPGPDPALVEWREVLLSPKPEQGSGPGYEEHVFGDPEISKPCLGCSAWCCKTLVFSRDLPENAHEFDFFRYCLGFPSVEVGVSEDGWAVVVHTSCRHLIADSCSLYGSEDRPLRCGYYDELKCVYRSHFGQPRPDDFVRVTRDEFPVLEASVVFDDEGRVRRVPTVDLLRARIESAIRAGAI
jgi:hypothetical protein